MYLTLKDKVPTNLTMKQKDALKKEGKDPETDLNGNVLLPRFKCVTSHTARRTGITNMYLSHKYDIVQMMHVSGHKTPKDFHGLHQTLLEEIAATKSPPEPRKTAKCGNYRLSHRENPDSVSIFARY